MDDIKFGTDGWRGIIAGDFTFASARFVAQAIARYVVRSEDPRKGLLIGYDHRFGADRIAAAVADVISSTGTPVWLTDRPCPTPAISLLVRQRQAAGGIMITASHNPPVERNQIQGELRQQRATGNRRPDRKRTCDRLGFWCCFLAAPEESHTSD
jgi:phosphomannomutase